MVTIISVVVGIVGSIIKGQKTGQLIDNAQFSQDYHEMMDEYEDLLCKAADGTATPEELDKLFDGNYDQRRAEGFIQNQQNIIDLGMGWRITVSGHSLVK